MFDHLITYRKTTNDSSLHEERDRSSNSTYLHQLLGNILDGIARIGETKYQAKLNGNERENNTIITYSILDYFISYTDLNTRNYAGYTCAQLIFIGVWKDPKIKEMLYHKKIDLTITDNYGKNIYSYIDPKDDAEFKDLVKTLVLEDDKDSLGKLKNEISATSAIIDSIDPKILTDRKVYGLCEASTYNIILFTAYLSKKYINVYFPKVKYDETKYSTAKLVADMTNYSISSEYITINYEYTNLLHIAYSYMPYNIMWTSPDVYYIHPDVKNILKNLERKDINKKRRFVVFFIYIVYFNTDQILTSKCILTV